MPVIIKIFSDSLSIEILIKLKTFAEVWHFLGYESPITDELQLSEYLSDYSAWESSYIASPDRLLDDSGNLWVP